jgi:hypothetical protein
MKVLLIDYDGKLPNLAICKLSTWHKAQGDEVYLNTCDSPDKVYISTLFSWNRSEVEKLLQVYPNAEIGGTGWDKKKNLPDEIEVCKPDYNLYSVKDIYERIKKGIGSKEGKLNKAQIIVNAGMGFTSRGCIRNCSFCDVPEKEGEFHQVAEIKDLLNPKSNVLILLDNNLTADPDCIEKLHEIRDRKLIVDISQGIDVRLMTPEIAQALSEVKHLRSIHYAWDLMKFERQVMDGIKLFTQFVKEWRHMCFTLTCFNTTFDEDMYRYRRLTEMKIKPYVMAYNNSHTTLRDFYFEGWVNSRKHTVCDFEEFTPWVKARNNPQLSLF